MKEKIEFRLNYDYANLLFKDNEGKDIGQLGKKLVKVVELSKDDPRFAKIPIVAKYITEKYNKGFLFDWKIRRIYDKKELDAAILFLIKVKTVFEPAGEECGTLYDETVACELCGANRKQIGALRLKKGSIPKKDIAKTIAGEIIVSAKFVTAYYRNRLAGAIFAPVFIGNKLSSNYYQLVILPKLELNNKTIAGNDPFETSDGSVGGIYNISGYMIKFEKETYNCPKGHLIGLNLLSEVYVYNSPVITESDIFATLQKIGVKRGLLRPESIYLCSKTFTNMVKEEKLVGFEFEIAHIE